MSRSIGVIGLGPMGGAIARALVAHGNEVLVWNRTAEVARRLPGATPSESVAALIGQVDCIARLPTLARHRRDDRALRWFASLVRRLGEQLGKPGPGTAVLG